MRVITDFHLHSKWSRSCSSQLTLPNIAKACERKGINLVGTADAFHPAWRKDIGSELKETAPGTFELQDGSSPTKFLLSTEISCIYKKGDKTRRVHHVILFPSLAALDRLTAALEARGCNLKSDGRPIVGIGSEELIKMVLDADPECLLIPAHVWTPWFSVFGSKSGFGSIEECFGAMSQYIYALETGLSSDPAMNWRCSKLDKFFLVSNSDAHSLEKLGREANVFEMHAPTYQNLRRILVEHETANFPLTIEFFPEEGKYHADGHRACGYWCAPEQTKKMHGACPKCGKPLTVGVLHRVADLADREPNPPKPPGAAAFVSAIPLVEVVAGVLGVGVSSKRVGLEMSHIWQSGKTEFEILLSLDADELARVTNSEMASAVMAMRHGQVEATPGYDGEFGIIKPRVTSKRPEQKILL
jgi:uncharacterized protein (TIGR00375 family)